MKKITQFLSGAAFAIVPACPILNGAPNCGQNEFGQLINNVFSFLITISIPLAVLVIIYGGVMLFISGGSEDRIKAGKNAILSAVIGLVIIFGSWFIYKAVFNAITGQSLFSSVPVAMAATEIGSNPTGSGLLINPPPGIPTDATQLIANITTWILSISGIVATFMVLYGAFLILTAGGNEERYSSGKKTIFYAVIGLVVIILSSGIVQIVQNLLSGKL